MAPGSSAIRRRQSWGSVARHRWSALLGRAGWAALLGLMLSLVLAILLGFAIPARVESTLLDERADSFSRIAADLVNEGLLDPVTGAPIDREVFDTAVRHRLIGGNVVRVVLWDRSGTAVYSDAPELIGLVDSSEEIARALTGEVVISVPSAVEGDRESVSGAALVREYYVPLASSSGDILGVFEVYEDAASIGSILSSTRRMVWVSLLLGIGMLVVFLWMLARASMRVLDRRRHQAEGLVAEMARAQESERKRVMGTLHDEIGQPLYRVLYGIEGSLPLVGEETPVGQELSRISDLVRWISGALRSELHLLHQGSITETDLDTLLTRLAADLRAESSLEIGLTITGHAPLAEGPRAALYRAAREAAMNARRHANASRLDMSLTEGSHRVIVDVQDDGSGFSGLDGLGLTTTRERLEAIGGGLEVTSIEGEGTLFRAWVPITEAGSR